MKLSKLLKMLWCYDSLQGLETFLYECNREGLVHTTINYHSQSEGCLTFNTENQVAENLFAFGSSLNRVYSKIMQATDYGNSQRDRMFKKVNRKLEEELEEMKQRAKKAEDERVAKAAKKAIDDQKRADAELAEGERQKKLASEAKIRHEQKLARIAIVNQLRIERKKRCQDILHYLTIIGEKKINKVKIKDLFDQDEDPTKSRIDYVGDIYQDEDEVEQPNYLVTWLQVIEAF
jgi:hypothetical protein